MLDPAALGHDQVGGHGAPDAELLVAGLQIKTQELEQLLDLLLRQSGGKLDPGHRLLGLVLWAGQVILVHGERPGHRRPGAVDVSSALVDHAVSNELEAHHAVLMTSLCLDHGHTGHRTEQQLQL